MHESKGLVGQSTLTKRRRWAVNLEGAKIKTYKDPKPDKMSENKIIVKTEKAQHAWDNEQNKKKMN